MTKISGVALVKKPVCWSLRWPYQASVINTLDARRRRMVYKAFIKEFDDLIKLAVKEKRA